ncbi:MAG: hypothetical protein HOP13_15450 [Alphaproteobacteria bacterium]|nr:hypothetical protein [Alphaproteobacteria bacterium]
MPQFRLSPFTGDVMQTINPWTWVFNVNLGNSGAPEIERLVLDEVGSYGRQLGRVGDALAVLVKKARDPGYAFTEKDNNALDDLLSQVRAVDDVKKNYRGRRT